MDASSTTESSTPIINLTFVTHKLPGLRLTVRGAYQFQKVRENRTHVFLSLFGPRMQKH